MSDNREAKLPEETPTEVVAFGFETFGTGLTDNLSIGHGDNYHMIHLTFDGYQTFEDADAIIFEAGCFDAFRKDFRYRGDLGAYKEGKAREIYARLCQGATVCLLVGSLPDTPYNLLEDVSPRAKRPDYRLLRDLGISISQLDVPITAQKAKVPEFNSFLEAYGTATRAFRKDDGVFEFEICVAEDAPDILTGFAAKVKKGLLVCLPCLPRDRFETYIREMLNTLAPGVVAFSTKVLRERPAWLAEVHFMLEEPVLKEREEAQRKVLSCDEQLAGYEPLKRILYLSDDELAHAIPPVLEAIGFDKRHSFLIEDTSGSEHEDFRISQTAGDLLLIGEAKSTTHNVKPMHMSKLDEHRTASGLGSDFPALCIVNTFLGARTLKKKNTRVESRQCRIAREMNITVMRALDLFWLLDEMLSTDPSSRDVRDFLALLSKGGGWLEWTKRGPRLRSA